MLNDGDTISAGKHTLDANTVALANAVSAAHATHDVVIVVMHWGIEGSSCPTPVQRVVARLLIEHGATAVLGAHPHVLQPIEAASTPTGETIAPIVAYSIGNFIWDRAPVTPPIRAFWSCASAATR